MKKHWWHDSKANTAIFSIALSITLFVVGFACIYFLSKTGVVFDLPTKNLETIDEPIRIIIPKISLDANVQQVGTTTTGRMGVPNNFTDVAWYKFGPRPGDAGSANISGHLDTATDINAVFIKLDQLKAGDEIDVVDKSGQKIKFKVIDTEIYFEDLAPISKIFDFTGTSSRLNLITCDGAWDQGTRNYNKRLVVYSERVLD